MNSIITDMYRKKASNAGIGNGSVEETDCAVVSTSSGLSYCIDRTGVQTLTDQQQPAVSLSDPLTATDDKATAMTDKESAADDIIVIEDSDKHDRNLNSGVNMPEHSSTADVNKDCSAEEKLAVTYLHLLSFLSPPF